MIRVFLAWATKCIFILILRNICILTVTCLKLSLSFLLQEETTGNTKTYSPLPRQKNCKWAKSKILPTFLQSTVSRSPKESQVKFHNALEHIIHQINIVGGLWKQRLSDYPPPREIQWKERSFSQEKLKYYKNLSEFMTADQEPWKTLPERSSHCWFLKVDRIHAINPKSCSAPTSTKDLSLDRVEEFSPHEFMAKPGLSPGIMSFSIFPSGLRSSHLVGFLRLSHKTHMHWLPLRAF